MPTKSVRAAFVLVTLAFAWQPGVSRAIVIASPTYVFSIDGGEFGPVVTDPPYFGTIDINDSPTDHVTFADIFLAADPAIPTPALEFKNILSQGADPSITGAYDLDLEDTGGNYELAMILNNAADLFADTDGATVNSSSSLETYAPPAAPTFLAGNFSGNVDIPAPPALPLFATAVGLIALFRRRRGLSTTAA